MWKSVRTACLASASTLMLSATASAITIDWISVGNPGNAADTTGFGDVASAYRIAKHEVTNTQYAEFLNAVAATDPNQLYNPNMGFGFGGISRTCSPGCTYNVIPGRGDRPVAFVSIYDTFRFANWLHNGQPSGPQSGSTTEDGAYTITAQGVSANTITRNAGATYFLSSENEWYKAAYYDALSTSYFDYPAGSDAETTCTTPTAAANSANCRPGGPSTPTNVGSYTGSASPYGTFDQGGNVHEWNEEIIDGVRRGLRGGSFANGVAGLRSTTRNSLIPVNELSNIGFRIASIPEPGTGLLLAFGLLGLARRRSAWR